MISFGRSEKETGIMDCSWIIMEKESKHSIIDHRDINLTIAGIIWS